MYSIRTISLKYEQYKQYILGSIVVSLAIHQYNYVFYVGTHIRMMSPAQYHHASVVIYIIDPHTTEVEIRTGPYDFTTLHAFVYDKVLVHIE